MLLTLSSSSETISLVGNYSNNGSLVLTDTSLILAPFTNLSVGQDFVVDPGSVLVLERSSVLVVGGVLPCVFFQPATRIGMQPLFPSTSACFM